MMNHISKKISFYQLSRAKSVIVRLMNTSTNNEYEYSTNIHTIHFSLTLKE